MFLSKKILLTNNVRHRRELKWDLFTKKKLNEHYNHKHFLNFCEHKLPAFCIKGFFFNKYNKKIYTILTDKSNNNIISPTKYGIEIGYRVTTNYFNFLVLGKLISSNVYKTLLILCNGGAMVYYIHNEANGVQLATSNGVFAVVYKQVQDTHLTKIKLPSGQFKLLPSSSSAYFGRNGNVYYKYVIWGSWGFKYKNKKHRPVVRGVAMNPVDHINGGRSKIKKPFKNKYNKIAKKGK